MPLFARLNHESSQEYPAIAELKMLRDPFLVEFHKYAWFEKSRWLLLNQYRESKVTEFGQAGAILVEYCHNYPIIQKAVIGIMYHDRTVIFGSNDKLALTTILAEVTCLLKANNIEWSIRKLGKNFSKLRFVR